MENKPYDLKKQRQLDAHYQVMHILQKNPHYNQRELSRELGLSLGKLNYCIKALVNKGWIKIDNFSQSKTKLGYVYLLTPQGISEKARMTKDFLQRKINEYEALRAEIDLLKSELLSPEDTK
jgi:EPS-associated MarR family transcriptional regulator